MNKWGNWITIGAMMFVWAGPAAGATDAEKCEAAKLKIAGKYNFCRLKAKAKAVKTGDPADYTKCDSKYGLKWGTAETNGGDMCPTTGDQTAVQDQVTADTDFIAMKFTGARWVDNGDGTVTDVQTGLMWEKKDDLGGIHDKDNGYTWSVTGTPPDGTAFTTFLGTLNNGESTDGTTISGCFAGHCDWRLPTSAELQTIVLAPFPCGTNPCIDPIFGPTQSNDYWTSTTHGGFLQENIAWYVDFIDGFVGNNIKASLSYVRAVRGGS